MSINKFNSEGYYDPTTYEAPVSYTHLFLYFLFLLGICLCKSPAGN